MQEKFSNMFESKFKLYQEIYHITPDSPKGFIKEIILYATNGRIKYLVVWDHQLEDWYEEIELTEIKKF